MVKGKIVLIQFPFDDFSSFKVRPAVCLTEPMGTHRHVVLAFITSRIPPDFSEADLVLDASRPDFKATGLAVTSTIRLHRPDDCQRVNDQKRIGMAVRNNND